MRWKCLANNKNCFLLSTPLPLLSLRAILLILRARLAARRAALAALRACLRALRALERWCLFSKFLMRSTFWRMRVRICFLQVEVVQSAAWRNNCPMRT